MQTTGTADMPENDIRWMIPHPSAEQIKTALRLCAVDEPADKCPCDQCYLYPFRRNGRMSTGRTCFEHLALDACQLIDRLNDFDRTQSKIALERCQRAEAQLAESQRRERAAVNQICKNCKAIALMNGVRHICLEECEWRVPQDAER